MKISGYDFPGRTDSSFTCSGYYFSPPTRIHADAPICRLGLGTPKGMGYWQFRKAGIRFNDVHRIDNHTETVAHIHQNHIPATSTAEPPAREAVPFREGLQTTLIKIRMRTPPDIKIIHKEMIFPQGISTEKGHYPILKVGGFSSMPK
jgi:hypothetical protein